uniref:ATP synthase subunit a n=1 Tax=Cecidomyiidae sp. 3 LC-2017 TaxID=2030135 RepID=A0A343LA45_9DIPT|nr:ATP synthase F0 subunit 6 [Cecidomyiidae sp. 3 LC-2017]
MMSNLFSMFDPATSIYFSLNWIYMSLFTLFIPQLYWLIPSSITLFYLKFTKLLFYEFKLILLKKNNNFSLIFISLMMFILINNFMGLFPYIFTSTSHLIMNMSLSLTLWMSMMLFGWMNTINNMFIHLVPQGTPTFLIMFMVLIESISNLMRPITLTIRLTANMIAGHLLLNLLSSLSYIINFMSQMFLFGLIIILLSLESAVSIIQSYVFAILTVLYIKEI